MKAPVDKNAAETGPGMSWEAFVPAPHDSPDDVHSAFIGPKIIERDDEEDQQPTPTSFETTDRSLETRKQRRLLEDMMTYTRT